MMNHRDAGAGHSSHNDKIGLELLGQCGNLFVGSVFYQVHLGIAVLRRSQPQRAGDPAHTLIKDCLLPAP